MYLLADLHLPICVTIPHAPRSPLSPLCHVRVSSPPDSDDVQHSRHGDNLKALREKWGGGARFLFFCQYRPIFHFILVCQCGLECSKQDKAPDSLLYSFYAIFSFNYLFSPSSWSDLQTVVFFCTQCLAADAGLI